MTEYKFLYLPKLHFDNSNSFVVRDRLERWYDNLRVTPEVSGFVIGCDPLSVDLILVPGHILDLSFVEMYHDIGSTN